MHPETCQIQLSALFGDAPPGVPRSSTARAARTLRQADSVGAWLLDRCAGGAACCFLRRRAEEDQSLHLTLSGAYALDAAAAGGWLLVAADPGEPSYWLPQAPMLRTLDGQGHILSERRAELAALALHAGRCTAQFDLPGGFFLDLAVWQLAPGSAIVRELQSASALERGPFFLWGSHTTYRRAADLYLHLVYGHAYEGRFAWPHGRKICSENDAHALYVTLCGLQLATGKSLYGLLKQQLLLSVLDRQEPDGGWHHGEWTGDMESHYRLHCSGMHLLLDALGEGDDPQLRRSLERAALFVAGRSDSIDAGVWFLHDSLEHGLEAFRKGPFSFVSSRAFGKSQANMLVLNTHLDTSVALSRYGAVTGDQQFAGKLESAGRATRAVLDARPAEWLYGPLFRAIGLTFLPTRQAQQLPWQLRALKRIAWKYLIPGLPALKARFPRLVMPGGYIDRELTLRTWAVDYQSINLMDLTRYSRRQADRELFALSAASLRSTMESGLAQRWKELPGKEYAAGFLAEALYHACLSDPGAQYRAWLAETVLDLQDRQQGLPPSLLGGNAEAVGVADQLPCPAPADRRLRVANLSRGGVAEILAINPGPEALPLVWESGGLPGLDWSDAHGGALLGLPLQVPARGWIWGKAACVRLGEAACASRS